MIEVVRPGSWTTIQDRGRLGMERYGISPGGPVDWFAARVANRMAGNREDAALLECTLQAPILRFSAAAMFAVAGGILKGVGAWMLQSIESGAVIDLGHIGPGLRTYVAIRGGLAVEPALGSRALCQLGHFGGGFGRPLQAGDRIPIGTDIAGDLIAAWPGSHRLPLRGPWEVRAMAGPHEDAFPRGALGRLTGTALMVTPRLDRIGMRLRSPGLRLRASEIVTTGVPEGAIQVTPSGELILFLAEHPVTGGYPVIATVIRADLPLVAQARPGDTIHLRIVGGDEAARARRRLEEWLA